MTCLHPSCPMGNGFPTWNNVLSDNRIAIRTIDRAPVLSFLSSLGSLGQQSNWVIQNNALLKRLLKWCPCLYTQLDYETSAESIVHLCEITLATPIVSSNAYDAFCIQNPNNTSINFRIHALNFRGIPGDISEALCSEILSNEGLPALEVDSTGWPIYNRIGHISLNQGRMRAVKAFGDILIPCAPSNLIISVKTQAAKERLLYSANMIEGVGFGFFNEAKEFWTPSRMNLFKRMGFTVIYLPDLVHASIIAELTRKNIQSLATNVNGKALYRPMSIFGSDMVDVAGKHSLHL